MPSVLPILYRSLTLASVLSLHLQTGRSTYYTEMMPPEAPYFCCLQKV